MSDDEGFWVLIAAFFLVSLWYSEHYQEIIDFKNSVISTAAMVFNCILLLIGGIALVGIGYYCTQRIHERY